MDETTSVLYLVLRMNDILDYYTASDQSFFPTLLDTLVVRPGLLARTEIFNTSEGGMYIQH